MKTCKDLKLIFSVFIVTIFSFSLWQLRDSADRISIQSIVQAAEEYSSYHDIKVTLSWDSVYANLDLYVKEPTGETASRWNPATSTGGEIGYYDYDTGSEVWVSGDNGLGVGRETYRLQEGVEGNYEISVYCSGLSAGETTSASLFVILNEETHKEEYPQFPSVPLGGETTWQAGSFYYTPLPGSGGCFISTAAYGTPLAQEVRILCLFRDRHLMENCAGRAFIRMYEVVSPPFSKLIARNKWLKTIVRMQLTPLVELSKFILII